MSDGNYEVFFDGAKFVRWDDIKNKKVPITSGLYLTGRSLKLMQDELLYDAVKDVNVTNFTINHVAINFVQGVPGCGKTHCIVENTPVNPRKTLRVDDAVRSY
jgi:hypothetical protein